MDGQGIISATLQAAIEYARYGWQVVPVYGIFRERCECTKGADCPSPGKHPRLKEWQKNCSTDEETISEWLEKWPRTNIGVRLGPESGIVDIEFDNEQGRKLAERILGQCFTPTFASARSVHRLFRWNDGLPRKTVPKIGGLECRLGQDDRGAQTVFPPSQHASGVVYQWLDGLAPGQVDVAQIPDALLSLLVNQEDYQETNGKPRSPDVQRFFKTEQIGAGERNDLMHAFACHQWRRAQQLHLGRAFNDQSIEQEVWAYVWAQNNARCRPPLDNDELVKLFRSAKEYISRQFSTDSTQAGNKLTSLGLEFKDGEWWPGLWSIEVHKGHEPVVHLLLPENEVLIPLENYDEQDLVSKAVLVQTQGNVYLNHKPRFWSTVWNGRVPSKEDPGCEGVKVKLMRAAKFVDAHVERRRENQLAEFILATIGEPRIIELVDATPKMRPFRDADGGYWFKFRELTEAAVMSRFDTTRNELSEFLRTNGVVDKVAGPDDRRTRFLYANAASWKRIQLLNT